MKLFGIALIGLMCCALSAMEIPFSHESVKTDANLFEDFVRVDPDDKKPETLKTRCWLWYDEDALHAEFSAEIDSTFKKGMYYPKDSGQDGDYIRLQLITIPEAYYAYYYVATPTNNLNDAVRTEQNVDFKWNSSYTYQQEVKGDSLWIAHLVIPFKELRFNAKPPYRWKVIFSRYNQDKMEMYSRPYVTGKMGKDYFLKAQDITLSQQIKRSSDLKFKPYFVKSYDLLTKTDTFDPDNLGMDISFNPSTRTKLKIALNPDFTDTPPDNAQNDYNNRYPPWYMENRFFFIEDLDAFGVDYSLFYTRHIAQPQVAVKLTGNSQTWNYGFLSALDKKIVDDGYTINYNDYYQLASIIKTLPRFKAIVSSAARMNEGYLNHLNSEYWEWEFINKLYIGQSGAFTYKHPRPSDPADTTNLQGYLYKVFIKAKPGNWNCEAAYSKLSKDFRADMGTIYETNYDNYYYDLNWSADTKDEYLKQWGFNQSGSYQNNLDSAKSLSYSNLYANMWFQFKPKYSVTIGGGPSREGYQGREYNQWSLMFIYNWFHYDNFGFMLAPGLGKTLVYSLKDTYNYYNLSADLWGSFGQKLDWSLSLTQYNYAYPRTVVLVTPIDTTTVVNDNLYQIGSAKLNYNFSNTIALRNGLSLTSYDADGDYARITFYSNFRYEFKQDCFLYLGYKTGQAQDEQSVWKDPLGRFKRNSASAYLKASLTI